jgi:hypothetical protein
MVLMQYPLVVTRDRQGRCRLAMLPLGMNLARTRNHRVQVQLNPLLFPNLPMTLALMRTSQTVTIVDRSSRLAAASPRLPMPRSRIRVGRRLAASPRAATPTTLEPARAGRPIAASLPAMTQASPAPDPLTASTAQIHCLIMASPPAAMARAKPVRAIVIITVQVLRPIGATQSRATRAPSRVVTITAGVGHLTTAGHQVGIRLLMTIAVKLPRVIMVTSVKAIEASPGTHPIRAANPPVVTIIVRVGRRIAGTHRVMIMIAVRRVMANTRVIRMQHRVGVSQVIVLPTSLVLARSRRVAIIAVRDDHLTGVDLPAMAMISVIQVQATTTGSRPNPLGFPPGILPQASCPSPVPPAGPCHLRTIRTANIEVPTFRERTLVICTDHRASQGTNRDLIGMRVVPRGEQMNSPPLLVSLSRVSPRARLS